MTVKAACTANTLRQGVWSMLARSLNAFNFTTDRFSRIKGYQGAPLYDHLCCSGKSWLASVGVFCL